MEINALDVKYCVVMLLAPIFGQSVTKYLPDQIHHWVILISLLRFSFLSYFKNSIEKANFE